jgi:hypothetical protein
LRTLRYTFSENLSGHNLPSHQYKKPQVNADQDVPLLCFRILHVEIYWFPWLARLEAYVHKTTQTQKPRTNNHARSGFGAPHSGVQVRESTCHRPRDYTIIGEIQVGILQYPNATSTSLPPSSSQFIIHITPYFFLSNIINFLLIWYIRSKLQVLKIISVPVARTYTYPQRSRIVFEN